jgi:hypothetical protein
LAQSIRRPASRLSVHLGVHSCSDIRVRVIYIKKVCPTADSIRDGGRSRFREVASTEPVEVMHARSINVCGAWRPARRARRRRGSLRMREVTHTDTLTHVHTDTRATHHTQRDCNVNDEFSKKAIPKGISIDVSVSVTGGDTPFASPFASPSAAAGEESEDGRQIRRRARAVRQMMMSGRCVNARAGACVCVCVCREVVQRQGRAFSCHRVCVSVCVCTCRSVPKERECVFVCVRVHRK